jgi:TPR repeat protein
MALAAHWYARAADAGLARAKLGLGLIRLTGGDGLTDKPLACALIAEAAEAEIPTALYMLGTLHEAGVAPLSFDEARAAALYRRAAEAGVRPACARLGLALLEGWGVARNPIEAETWLRRAAIAGDAEAAALVGDLHSNNADGMPNHVEAFGWYRLAAEHGHRQAMRSIGLMYMGGLGAPRDSEEAMRWLGAAMEAGDTQAAADLGAMIQRLGADSADAARVADVFEKAARGGDPVAAFNYAVCLKGGLGRPQDAAQAAEWMRHAGENGVVNALYWHGRMLIEAGDESGRLWIERAADEGMAEAAAELGRPAPLEPASAGSPAADAPG